MESVTSVPVTMTPCMDDGGRHYGHEGPACSKCPKVLGKFKCQHRCHRPKKRVIRRKPRA